MQWTVKRTPGIHLDCISQKSALFSPFSFRLITPISSPKPIVYTSTNFSHIYSLHGQSVWLTPSFFYLFLPAGCNVWSLVAYETIHKNEGWGEEAAGWVSRASHVGGKGSDCPEKELTDLKARGKKRQRWSFIFSGVGTRRGWSPPQN